MTVQTTRRITAVVAVAILLVAFTGTSVMVQDDDNETDAIFGIDDALFFFLVLSAVETGILIGDFIVNHYGDDDEGQSDDIVRGYEAESVANSIINNLQIYDNTMSNYAQIWVLTDDHHIRQSELAATELWTPDAEFDPSQILEWGGVYLNSAYMMDNAASQINRMFDLVSSSLDDWNASETYSDKMELRISYGSGSISTKTDFSMFIGTTTGQVEDGRDQVYLTSESHLWADSDAVLTSSDGTTVTISGQTDTELADVPGFSDGVWTLQDGVSYCGDILSVIGTDAAPVYAGAVVTCGDVTKLAVYDGSAVIVDGVQSSDLSLTIIPEGAASQTVDLTPMLDDLSGLIDTIYGVMAGAVSGAASVWSIFDQAGHASAYLTTLMVPNEYEGMELTTTQQTLITVLALEQLADYWDSTDGQLKTTDYVMSDSMSLFVRGDIISDTGETLYSDVIFTPFFNQDTSLDVGSNSINRMATLAIWTDGVNLSSWDGITNASKAQLVPAESGYRIQIYEMKYEGQMTNHVDLTVKNIDIIDPNELVHTVFPDEADNDLDKIIMLALVLLGLLALISGWRSGSYVAMFIGIVLVLVGLFFSGTIEDCLYDWFGWRIELG